MRYQRVSVGRVNDMNKQCQMKILATKAIRADVLSKYPSTIELNDGTVIKGEGWRSELLIDLDKIIALAESAGSETTYQV